MINPLAVVPKKVWIGVAVTVALLGYHYYIISGLKSEISKLNDNIVLLNKTIKSQNKDLEAKILETAGYKQAVGIQDIMIKDMEVKSLEAKANYNKWKSKDKKEKYSVIEKIVYRDTNRTKENSCDNIKTMLNNIDSNFINNL